MTEISVFKVGPIGPGNSSKVRLCFWVNSGSVLIQFWCLEQFQYSGHNFVITHPN